MPKNTQNTAADTEQKKQSREEQARRAKRRSRQLLGLALAILIVVGGVSIIRWTFDLAVNLSQQSDSSEKDEFTARITPLVWFDVLPFESLAKADQNTLKEAAIWGIMNELGTEVQRNENGEPLIPAAEVDRYMADLYGPDFEIVHESFVDTYYNLTYDYDEATNTYTAQNAGLTPQYLPTVVEVVSESGGKRVVVGYVSTTGSNDELISTPDFDHPARYMDYYFRRSGNDFYLASITPNLTYTAEAQAAQAASHQATAPSSEAVVEGFEDVESGTDAVSSDSTDATSAPGGESAESTASSDSASAESAPADESAV